MIAMQYSIVLPADYDMGIIDRRIDERGRLTDGFPGLVFKAYLQTRKTGPAPSASENLYAPFYLWHSTEGMNDFLCGPGFVGLTQSFGWPSVQTWSVWHAQVSGHVAEARFSVREVMPIAAYADLVRMRAAETESAQDMSSKEGVVASIAGFEPTTWSIVRFQLWTEQPHILPASNRRIYGVGHVSTGGA